MRIRVHPASKIYHPEHGYENTLAAVQDSLDKFGCSTLSLHLRSSGCLLKAPACPDYFDLYLIHSGLSGKEKRLDTWRALIDARNAGKIKSIGVSN